MNENSSENGRILDARLKRARVITVSVLVTFAVAVVAFAVVCVVDSHLRNRVHSDYADYFCYDYNLTCLDYGRPDGKYYIDGDENYAFRYWRINGESTEDFVYATAQWNVPLASAESFVLQNPKSFVNVIREWTVEDVLVCVEAVSHGERETIPLAHVVDADKKNAVAAEIRKIAAGEQSDELTGNRIYTASEFFVRVTFRESKNVVWESELTVCDDGSLAMCGGMTMGKCYYGADAYNPVILIDEDSVLYSLIGFAMEKFKNTEIYADLYSETKDVQ